VAVAEAEEAEEEAAVAEAEEAEEEAAVAEAEEAEEEAVEEPVAEVVEEPVAEVVEASDEETELGEAEPHDVVAAAEEIAAAAAESDDPGGESEPEPVPVAVGTAEALGAEDLSDDAQATFVAVEDAAEPEAEDASVFVAEMAPLRPGEVAQTTIAVWKPDAAGEFREHLREVQALFVDEPVAAVSQAQSLVADAVRALAEALLAEQLDLDPRQYSDNPDTEALRIALRRYRDFLERVLAL
jgi:hypothetical protein